MQPKPNPADFTHNGELQQPHYDNAVRAWEKLERMGQDEIEKAARSKSYKYREATYDKFVTVGKDKVQAISAALNARSGFEDGFKVGVEWANEQKRWVRWVKASERLPDMEKFLFVKDNVGCKRLGNFFEDEDGEIKFSVLGTETYSTFLVQQKNFWGIEWLEELYK